MHAALRFLAPWLFFFPVLAPGLAATGPAVAPAPDLASNPSSNDFPANPDLPTLFIAGDSTAARGKDETQRGWGVPFASYFDASKVNVVNRARGGRSARTFRTEGLWSTLLAEVKKGDVVLIQFGHNDGGPLNEGRARGSLPGLGEGTENIENLVTKQPETVHTFGWYLRQMVAEVKAKGATPVVLSPTVRNVWSKGRIERGPGPYAEWSRRVALDTAVGFVDVSVLAADHLQAIGEPSAAVLYPQDHTHFNAAGADLHAAAVVAGLKGLKWKKPGPVDGWLSPRGEAVVPDALAWLRLPVPRNAQVPTLFLIGDSTVRNGQGDGVDGQWGWGDFLEPYFDPSRINVVNRAVGGTGARTFRNAGYWNRVMSLMKPGDTVILQFGHNDNGQRGALPGTGEETETRTDEKSGDIEIVHTFGWYLRQYVRETRAKGATPILCSPVPRKKWTEGDGKILRSRDTHAGWTAEVACTENVPLIDLNETIGGIYDALGREKVAALFADEHTHTNRAGAELNAKQVADALRALPEKPVGWKE